MIETSETIVLIIRLVMAAIAAVVTIFLVPWLKGNVVPWLKEKRLYQLVKYFVMAAEKLASTGVISKAAKLDYVVSLLTKYGYSVDAPVRAMIEAAVEELDVLAGNVAHSITGGDGDDSGQQTDPEVSAGT